VEFGVDADCEHLPVALASMSAKYLRELLMQRFNDYWRGLAPAVTPTAGYYQDALRFLEDLEFILGSERAPIRRELFVRSR
jgi:hypothetical protein